MKFNKFLAMCFLASTMMCGSFTSCGDDDDAPSSVEDGKNKVEDGKATIEQGRADGKELAQIYKDVTSGGLSMESVASATKVMTLVNKYRNSDDKVYKGAFAEALVEAYYGTEEKGDEAIAKVDGLLKNIDNVLNLLNGGNKTQE